jgi:YVTN family beta-propeller protein
MASAASVVVVGCLLATYLVASPQSGHFEEKYPSPTALAVGADGKTLFVAEQNASRVVAWDTSTNKPGKAMQLAGPPADIALSPDGKMLLAAIAQPEGKVCMFDTASGNKLRCASVGHTPSAVCISPDGAKAYVCNRFDDSISVVDIADGEETGRIDVVREPIDAALTPDGKWLYVANHLPAGAADGAYAAATVSVVDVQAGTQVKKIALPNGSTGLRGVCISPDGKNVYVTHILGRYQLPTTQLDRGWMNTNALTVIDTSSKDRVNTVLLDNIDRGAANPWGVTVTADGKHICVTHAGTHEVSVIDRAALHQRLTDAASGKEVTEVSDSADDVPNDLAFLVGIRRRLNLSGNGPRAVAVVGGTIYAAEYFSDSIGMIALDAEDNATGQSVALGQSDQMSVTRRGEMLFNDARMCFQGWQSCASCHPDARADGLNWDLLNDGIGNPRQTKSMLLAHKTPPAMITGVRAKAEIAVRAGMRYIQFTIFPEEDAVAIDEYLTSMKPIPSPRLVDGKLSASAQRGKAIFDSAACSACHPAPLYTDMQMYDVGTGLDRDKGRKFDTPSLVECWRTAPYLYDGRAATMMDVLTDHNKDNKHGKTSDLNEQQLKDLVEYVLSL